jgi:hypothetical protein
METLRIVLYSLISIGITSFAIDIYAAWREHQDWKHRQATKWKDEQ